MIIVIIILYIQVQISKGWPK